MCQLRREVPREFEEFKLSLILINN
jgi:hypothetical protein